MSEESTFREPSPDERRLLHALAEQWKESPQSWTEIVSVRAMKDEGMGSLVLHLPQVPAGLRKFGGRVAELQFKDSDGVDVIASLNIDQHRLPFELDVWKTDFSPLKRIPQTLDPNPQ